jgi:uncharacterized membrane protein
MTRPKATLSLAVLLLASVLPTQAQRSKARIHAPVIVSSGGVHETGAIPFTYDTFVLFGANTTLPYGINSKNIVVGGYGSGFTNGFVLRNGVATKFVFPQSETAVTGINSFSDLVGTYNADGGAKNAQGFIFSNGTFTTLSVPGATVTGPNGINDTGSVVGVYLDENSNSGSDQGFLYSGGAFTTLNFPGATGTGALGINNHGQIVGFYFDSFGITYSFIHSDGVFQQLTVPGCDDSFAYGINNHSDIVGFCQHSGRTSGFLYKDGAFTFLSFPGADTFALAINDDDEIVGFYNPPGTVNVSRGFRATPSN